MNKRFMEKISVAAYVLLAVVATADVLMFAFVIFTKHAIRTPDGIFRDAQARKGGSPPRGFSTSGVPFSKRVDHGNGWVVHYASPTCVHCRTDEPRWSRLKMQLAAKGYEISQVPPAPSQAYAENAPELASETQISFVNVDWMKRFRLTATPTTLLFDRAGTLIWSQKGEMSEGDEKSAMYAVRWSQLGSSK
jgi:hypothetical protein